MGNNTGSPAFKNIVVGVSDAATSQIAGRKAVELAEATGATVHFVTAVENGETAVIEIGSDRFVLDTVESARIAVEHFVHGLGSSINYTVQAVEEAPAKALVSVAELLDADLIVVGNVRMQGLARVLGSVGNDVAHSAPCSVLIVKTV
jgi:nucleotide-binding universal stress UspA family protein